MGLAWEALPALAGRGDSRLRCTTPYCYQAYPHCAKLNGKGPFKLHHGHRRPTPYSSTAAAKKDGVDAGQNRLGHLLSAGDRGRIWCLTNVKGRIEEPFQLIGMKRMGMAGVDCTGPSAVTDPVALPDELDLQGQDGVAMLNFEPDPPRGPGRQWRHRCGGSKSSAA